MFPEIENVRQVNGVNWSGGVLAQNGKMYGMSWTASSVCIIKTRIPTLPAWMLAPEFNKFYFFFKNFF